jgi:hypothetical protein
MNGPWKYAIRLRSKYTGQIVCLGSKFNTHEDAVNWAESNVCKRCNYVEFYPVRTDWIWVDKDSGFTARFERI